METVVEKYFQIVYNTERYIVYRRRPLRCIMSGMISPFRFMRIYEPILITSMESKGYELLESNNNECLSWYRFRKVQP